MRFLWRDAQTWYAVRLERRSSPDGRDAALVTYVSTELPFKLTSREIDILTLVALGLTNGQVAIRLGTSPRTVSTQVERLLTKLDQRTRGGLAALVVDGGLLRLPVPGGVEDLPHIGPVEVEALAGGAPPATTSGGATRLRRRPLLLGTVTPSLGPVGADGIETLRGSGLAVEHVNARGGVGGRPIEHLTVAVDLTDADAVRRAFETLFDQEVDAITTSYVNAENPFVLDLIADFGRPFLHLGTYESQVDLVRQDPVRYGMVFQTCPSETHYGSALISFLDSLEEQRLWRPEARRIVTIEIDAVSTRTTNETFIRTAEQSRWVIHDLIRVPIGTRDWSEVIARVAAADPQVVMITHFVVEDVISLQAALHASGIQALVYHVYGASVPDFTSRLGDAAEGVFCSSVTGLYDDLLGDRFRYVYESRFGAAPGWSQASAAYDQVGLLAAAWSATDGHATHEVIRYLRQSAYRGLNGVYFLGDPGQSSRGYPYEVPDPSLGKAHMVYQFQSGRARAVFPATNGDLSAVRIPRVRA
ncbi:MAG: ABC transporter substrate-binding protein [Candidatus Nanopelagicales bacterium]